MTKTQKTAMYQQIEKHGNDLNSIFNTGLDAITLCKKLRTLELKANRIATDWCNGVIDTEDIEPIIAPVMKAVKKILFSKNPDLNKTDIVFFNGDARGYSLKISDKFIKGNNYSIHTDWGGYGIISPDFTPNN